MQPADASDRAAVAMRRTQRNRVGPGIAAFSGRSSVPGRRRPTTSPGVSEGTGHPRLARAPGHPWRGVYRRSSRGRKALATAAPGRRTTLRSLRQHPVRPRRGHARRIQEHRPWGQARGPALGRRVSTATLGVHLRDPSAMDGNDGGRSVDDAPWFGQYSVKATNRDSQAKVALTPPATLDRGHPFP